MQTQIDFENLPEWTFVTSDYAAKGVVFPTGAAIHTQPAKAHSAKKYLSAYYPEFSEAGTFVATFTRSTKRVTLWAGTERAAGALVFGALVAFDAQGAQLKVDGLKLVQPDACNTKFEVTASGYDIASIVVQMFAFDATGLAFAPEVAIDDLSFETEEPATLRVPKEPAIYDWLWYPKTHGGLIGPQPWGNPRLPGWTESWQVARRLTTAAGLVGTKLREEAMALARKQGELASQTFLARVKGAAGVKPAAKKAAAAPKAATKVAPAAEPTAFATKAAAKRAVAAKPAKPAPAPKKAAAPAPKKAAAPAPKKAAAPAPKKAAAPAPKKASGKSGAKKR